jgi:ribosomal subunit interface protein
MDIQYHFNGLREAEELRDTVTQKLEQLKKFTKRANSVYAEVEFSKTAAQHNGPVYRCEVNLRVDGALYRAEATEESFLAAVDEVRNELDKELRRAKGKYFALREKAGRTIKRLMRRGGGELA